MKHRLNGISTPVGGISWDNSPVEKDSIRFIFSYLASRRILVNPIEMEVVEQCIESVLEIRSTLVEETRNIDSKSKNLGEINKMIIACNEYLDKINELNLPHIIYKDGDRWENFKFDIAMKQFRATFKDAISNMEKKCSIDAKIVIPEKW